MNNILLLIELALLLGANSNQSVEVIKASSIATVAMTTNSIEVSSNDTLIATSELNSIFIDDIINNIKYTYNVTGRGPGEIGSIWKIKIINDFLYTYDASNGKILKFDTKLNFISEFKVKGNGMRGFLVIDDNIIMAANDNIFTLMFNNINTGEYTYFHKKIIPSGYQPSAYNATQIELHKDVIVAKYRAIDTLYSYNLKNLKLKNKASIEIDYEEDYDNPPIVPYLGEINKPTLIPFAEFEVINDQLIAAVVEGNILFLERNNNTYLVKHKVIIVDDTNTKLYIDNISV